MENQYLTVIHTEIPDLVQNISNGLVPAELKPFIGPAQEIWTAGRNVPRKAGAQKAQPPGRSPGGNGPQGKREGYSPFGRGPNRNRLY